jgi:hypothetical protein
MRMRMKVLTVKVNVTDLDQEVINDLIQAMDVQAEDTTARVISTAVTMVREEDV